MHSKNILHVKWAFSVYQEIKWNGQKHSANYPWHANKN